MTEPSANQPERAAWMGLLASAPPDLLEKGLGRLGPEPDFEWLRAPEIGAVMTRGRAGGTGAPFNLGEITVTRCALRLRDGTTGHAYVAGRDKEKARRAAICDALMQGERAAEMREAVLEPVAKALSERRAHLAGKAAATKVDFFTLVRGED
ncbi:MAG: phosphonate C-P lyase system protein PhnG [Pikeienuella sp.]